MFLYASATNERLKLYRDVLSVYKKIIAAGLKAYGLDKKYVEVKNTIKHNVNRAPLIVIERAPMQHIPRSLMLSEKISVDQNTNMFMSSTAHMLEYYINFICYGNSYLEAEKLGNLAMEAVLTTGMTIVKKMHPNIIGADLVGWGGSELVEGSNSSLIANTVTGKVFLHVDGIYTIEN